MINKPIPLFFILTTIVALESCSSLLYTNSFNKADSGYKLGSEDTIAIGYIIYQNAFVSNEYTDSIYAKFKAANICKLVSPDTVKKRLEKNKIFSVPYSFPAELCTELSGYLPSKYYLNSFITILNPASVYNDGKVEAQFDLYDLRLRKMIWTCKSSIHISVFDLRKPGSEDKFSIQGIHSASEAFNKLVAKVLQKEIDGIITRHATSRPYQEIPAEDKNR